MGERLTQAEDEELRRLEALEQFGMLTPLMAAVRDELRSRDRRRNVRAPRIVAIPLQNAGRDAGPVVLPR